MKKLTVILIGLFLMTFAFQSVNAQSNATSASSANIVKALTIVNDSPLNFGDISATATAGDIIITNANIRSGNSPQPVGTGGSAAQFTIEGLANESISVGVSPSTFVVTDPVSSETLPVTLNAQDVSDAQDVDNTGTTGSVVIKIGGSVAIPNAATATVGEYVNTAAFTVTVNYN